MNRISFGPDDAYRKRDSHGLITERKGNRERQTTKESYMPLYITTCFAKFDVEDLRDLHRALILTLLNTFRMD